MATPDIRVRLSAEGVAEVVAALQKVQDQTSKVAKSGAGSFGPLQAALRDIKSILPTIGIGATVLGIINLSKAAFEAADSAGKLGEKIGATAENASVLQAAAKLSGDSTDALEKSLIKLAVNLDALNGGSKEVATNLAKVGVSAKDLAGKDTAEAFGVIAENASKLGASTQKTAALMSLLGKNGRELIPFLNQLGEQGFENARKRAEQFGLLISNDLARAADQARDSIDAVKGQAQGFAISFASGFAPQIAQAFASINEAAENVNKNPFEKFGEYAGFTVRLIITLFRSAGDAIGAFAAFAVEAASNVFNTARRVMTGNFNGIVDDFAASFRRQYDIIRNGVETQSKLFADLGKDPDVPTGLGNKRSPVVEDPGAAAVRQASARARQQFLIAQLDNERKIQEAAAKLQSTKDQQAYEEGLLSLKDYYARRRETLEQGQADELALLQRKLAIAKSTPVVDAAEQAQKRESIDAIEDPAQRARRLAELEQQNDQARINRLREVAALESQIAEQRINGERESAELTQQELQAQQALGREVLGLEQQLLEAQGRRREAQLLGLQQELEAQEKILARAGATEDERARAREQLTTARTSQFNFDDATTQANRAFTAIRQARERIEQDVQLGLISERQAQLQIAEIEAGRLPVLQDLATAARAAAAASNNPELAQQAEDLSLQVDALAVSVERATNGWLELREQTTNALTSDLEEWLNTGISKAKSLGDAFKNLADSISASLQRIAANAVANRFFDYVSAAIGGYFGSSSTPAAAPAPTGGAGLGAPIAVKGGGLIQAREEGGMILGPGSERSDSIPAVTERGAPLLVSNKEWAVPPAQVSKPGVLPVLSWINAMRRLPAGTRPRVIPAGSFIMNAEATRAPGVQDFLRKLPSLGSVRPHREVVDRFAAGGLVGDLAPAAMRGGGAGGRPLVVQQYFQYHGAISRATQLQTARDAGRGVQEGIRKNG